MRPASANGVPGGAMAVSIIMTKQGCRLDPSVHKKAFSFMSKLTTDDTTPGLHIEPIRNAADPRVRTGRVDHQYRAVLFRIPQGRDTTYVFHGIWNHDEAIAVAQRTELRVNPANGLAEIRRRDPEQTVADRHLESSGGDEPARVLPDTKPTRASVIVGVSRAELIDELGLPDTLADAVLAATSEAELLRATDRRPEWQQLAVLGLGAQMGVDEVKAQLSLTQSPVPVRANDPAGDSDDALLEGLAHPAAAMEFAHITGADELRSVIESGDFEAWRVFLHPEQRRLVHTRTSGAYRLCGGAGTGKTVVVIHRANRLVTRPSAPRVVVTTFTVNLAAGMKRDLQRLNPRVTLAGALGEPGAWVAGIDAIARQVLRSAGDGIRQVTADVLGAPRADVRHVTPDTAWRHAITAAGNELPEHLRSVRFFQTEYSQVIVPHRIIDEGAYLEVRRFGRSTRLSQSVRSQVWSVVEAYREATRTAGTSDFYEAAAIAAEYLERRAADGHGRIADHVLVDEGQDLNPTHWQLLRAMVEPGPDDLFIAEDSHQRIFGGKVILSHHGILLRGRSRRLTLNYRTTAENLRYAVSILEGGAYSDLEAGDESTAGYRSARLGPEPVLHGAETVAEELDVAASIVGRWSDAVAAPQRDSIAVLVRDSRQRDLVISGLAERGVAVTAFDKDLSHPAAPVVMTMHRSKGTEFAKVLVFGVSEGSIPAALWQSGAANGEIHDAWLRERSLLYVAATRARDELAVTWSGTPSPLAPHAAEGRRTLTSATARRLAAEETRQ